MNIRADGKGMSDRRTILIAGMGTSPAVLTETVWALAHQKKAILPDEIVALVTRSGRERLCAELLSGERPVWERMLAALKKEKVKIDGKLIFGETSIRVIPDERGNGVWDLRSGEDNLRAADFMLQQIRQYTESPDTVVLASIAGGRKTLSALLFSCMSLLGREDDKVFHVLLPMEFEGGVEPQMYYPVKGVTYTNIRTGKKYKGDKFHSELFEVPFVRMRGWYQEKFKSIPPTYRTLISKVQTVAPPAVVYPEVEIDAWNGIVRVNGLDVHVGAVEFAVLLVLASGASRAEEIYRRLHQLKRQRSTGNSDWIERFAGSPKFADAYENDWKSASQEVSKVMSKLRKTFEKTGVGELDSLVPLRKCSVSFPIDKIRWKGKERLMDICGYLTRPLMKESGL